MKLVLAEKPSVAQSLAKVLGVTNRQDGYLEGNGYIVSWCVGHLVELAQPEAYDERYGKWTYGDLPILPDDWKYEVSAGTRKQFGILKKLMARDDVVSLVCATDAGREGELIFRLVYHQCHCKKPFERLWISSMEDSAIMEGFENLKPGTEYDALYEAALCRERADWIVGINASVEMQTVKLLAGSDGANVYKFTTTDEYTLLNIYISEYQAGELVNKERMGIGFEGIGSPKNGEIIIVPDYEHAVIKLVISTDEGSKFSTELPIMEGVEDKEYYGRSQSRIEGETKILYDIEQPLVGMIYDNDEMYVIDLYDLLSGETDSLSKNDYMYLFSYEFCKE